MKNPWYSNKWIWVTIMAVSLIVPFFINESYKCDGGYITNWDAGDVLAFYGSFLSFTGTTILGLVALAQTRKANLMTEKMLEIEDRREMPILDVIEITEERLPTAEAALSNALQVNLNDTYYFISRTNTMKSSDTDVVVFLLENISDNYIISMNLEGITYATKFQNGEILQSKPKSFSWTGGIRVFGCGERQYMVIGGVDFQYPAELTVDERLEKGYCQPSIILDLSFLLKNTRGRIYEEKIRLQYCYFPSDGNIHYPCILEKEILSLKSMEGLIF